MTFRMESLCAIVDKGGRKGVIYIRIVDEEMWRTCLGNGGHKIWNFRRVKLEGGRKLREDVS